MEVSGSQQAKSASECFIAVHKILAANELIREAHSCRMLVPREAAYVALVMRGKECCVTHFLA